MLDEFVTIATFRNSVDGDVMKAVLESNGIPCFIPDEQVASMKEFFSNFRLQVRGTDAENAMNILQHQEILQEAQSIASPMSKSFDIRPMKYRFSVENYNRLGETNIIHEDERVELIEGEIVTMTPIGDYHAGTVDYLTYVFAKKLGDRAIVRVQNPVHLDRYSEPQPDIVLLKPKDSFYRDGHPQPDDIYLIIEVTAGSADYDRDVKVSLYAKNGVREFWIVDLEKRIVETYREPSNGEYRNRKTYNPGDSLASESFPELRMSVSEILG